LLTPNQFAAILYLHGKLSPSCPSCPLKLHRLYSALLKNALKISLEQMFPLFPSSPFEVLFDFGGGEEARGVGKCIWWMTNASEVSKK
jgi:hypothetical protein